MFKGLSVILGIVMLWCLVDSLLYLVAPIAFLMLVIPRGGKFGK